MEGTGVVMEDFDLKQRGPGLAYTIVPFEMIRTAHSSPQVLVSIDDLPAICTGNCDYTYENPTGVINSMSVSGLQVTLTGTDLPIEIVSVKLAHTICEIDSNSATTIICSLVTPWVFGKYLPAVRDANGLVPIADTV